MDRDFRLWVWLWVWFYFPIVIGVGVGLWVVGLSSLVFFFPLLVRFLSVLSASSGCFCLRFGCDFRLWVCSLNQFLAVGCLQWLGGGFVLNCVLGCGGCGGCGGGCWLFAVAVDCV